MNDHYKGGEVETEDVRMYVVNLLDKTGVFKQEELCRIYDALKYSGRAGNKGPWRDDARKCADYLCKTFTGYWLDHFSEENAG